ncbi:hypothetical protein [Flavobacterium lindanitolerans]|uniref:hypothetical protein n=1 Tax=Flavobacterium lindanitolerans TaxID=428988 RepID=UPI0031CE9967
MSEAAPSRWLSDWKAGIAIIVLEIWICVSLISYFSVITKRATELTISSPIVFLPLIFIIALNYFAFVYTDIWKEYVAEFDQLPKKKNRIGSWIVFGVVLFVIANLIFSFYLMSQIDWSQY